MDDLRLITGRYTRVTCIDPALGHRTKTRACHCEAQTLLHSRQTLPVPHLSAPPRHHHLRFLLLPPLPSARGAAPPRARLCSALDGWRLAEARSTRERTGVHRGALWLSPSLRSRARMSQTPQSADPAAEVRTETNFPSLPHAC
eukprot:1260602-Rhodomonas_salina.2